MCVWAVERKTKVQSSVGVFEIKWNDSLGLLAGILINMKLTESIAPGRLLFRFSTLHMSGI